MQRLRQRLSHESKAAETLNFEAMDTVESEEMRSKLLSRSYRIERAVALYTLAVVTAILIALIYYGSHKWINVMSDYRMDSLVFAHKDDPGQAWILSTLFSATLVTIALVLVFIAPAATGSGIPEVIGYLNGVAIPGLVSFKTLIVKILGTGLAVGSGLMCDPEGPTVHIGASLSVVLMREVGFLRTFIFKRQDAEEPHLSSVAALSSSMSFLSFTFSNSSQHPNQTSSLGKASTSSFADASSSAYAPTYGMNSYSVGRSATSSAPSTPSAANPADCEEPESNFRISFWHRMKRFLHLRRVHHRAPKADRENVFFAMVGACTGLAAAFHSPLAGVVFAIEEAMSFFHPRLIFRCFLAASVSYWTLLIIYSGGSINVSDLVLFGDDANCQSTFDIGDFVAYVILGVISGLLGAAYNRVYLYLTHLRHRFIGEYPLRRWLEAMGIVIITALLTVYVPHGETCEPMSNALSVFSHLNLCANETKIVSAFADVCVPLSVQYMLTDLADSDVLANNGTLCYPWAFISSIVDLSPMRQVLDVPITEELGIDYFSCYYEWGSLLQVTPDNALRNLLRRGTYNIFSMKVLAGYFGIAFLLTQLTAGLAIPASNVLPALLVGGSLGRFFGMFVNEYIKIPLGARLIDPGLTAVIGAGSFWAGIARITLTVTLIMMDVTQSPDALAGLLIAIIASVTIGNALSPSLYHALLHVGNIPFIEHEPPPEAATERVHDLMSKPVLVIPRLVRAKFLHRMLSACSHHGFPVVEDYRRNRGLPAPTTPTGGHEQTKLGGLRRHGKLVGLVLRYHLEVALHQVVADALRRKEAEQARRHPTSEYLRARHQFAKVHHPNLHITNSSLVAPMPTATSVTQLDLLEAEALRALRHFDEQASSHTVRRGIIAPLSLVPDVLIDLSTIMHRSPTTIMAGMPVAKAFSVFRQLGLRHLVVVDHSYHVVGILTRSHFVKHTPHTSTDPDTPVEKDMYQTQSRASAATTPTRVSQDLPSRASIPMTPLHRLSRHIPGLARPASVFTFNGDPDAADATAANTAAAAAASTANTAAVTIPDDTRINVDHPTTPRFSIGGAHSPASAGSANNLSAGSGLDHGLDAEDDALSSSSDSSDSSDTSDSDEGDEPEHDPTQSAQQRQLIYELSQEPATVSQSSDLPVLAMEPEDGPEAFETDV
ncbi:hypothetical protein CAOG_001129 [Capsaspora owczarzaki ATCC 30864]|uniref:Chloride channel protein n=2 Tax=Capsaspora owczarzaki (strain ATCC 30864) TaxID=595528 RepID=A0A0D2WIL7_CAPO3|nr:hypothetical protein CAOG_001129 [Capsaspora owczarzaki ATCC 30864]